MATKGTVTFQDDEKTIIDMDMDIVVEKDKYDIFFWNNIFWKILKFQNWF